MTSMGRASGTRRTFRAQSLVEFALVAPIFLIMLFSVIEGSRIAYSYVALNHAVQEGGRTAALPGTGAVADVQSKVQASANPLTVSGVTVAVSGGKAFSARVSGDTVSVSASYAFTPVLSMVFGVGSIPLSATTSVSVE
jgi:Flp pilus assembly protein TadG